ncbi:MAG: hypothetical protein DCF15_17250 [Phormidesmis priestleyi]|uniref:Uncharacterized protein n=1 Tax=Phormidesmis priestleyi TaxID=268141 RepID=A0A2W4X102_9CYAN|nr:MAG: hypothetical protein DCF15_17250 [Phormidesmis priestleyi]
MAAAIVTTSTTLEGQMVEIASALQVAEAAVTENPENRVAIQFDVENNGISIQASLPGKFSYVGGKASMQATEYLT